MRLAEKETFEVDKGKSVTHSYSSSPTASDWRFAGGIGNTSGGFLHRETLLGFSKDDMVGTSSSSASVAVADSFLPSSWDQAVGSQALGLCDSSGIGIPRGDPDALRSCCMNSLLLDSPNSMARNCIFSPSIVGVLPPPQSLSQFPSDSAFIERAARFSNFNGGNLSAIGSHFPIAETLSLYTEGGGVNKGAQGLTSGTKWRSPMNVHTIKNEVNMGEISKGASLCSTHEAAELRLLHNRGENECSVRDHNHGVEASTNGSDEAEFSGDVGQEETSLHCTNQHSIKFVGSKKRKKIIQDTEGVQLKGSELQQESSQKGEQTPTTTTTNKSLPRPTKNGSQASDVPKEEYIHVRARRGQATNSHSLAERVRREKISERMKFLQDLVPGCSKVTGKAVMLDEIINYVQSLQRQVEFLSMKLATVNPRSDFNFEALRQKNVVESLPVVGFSTPDLVPPPFHQLTPGPQPGIFCMRNAAPAMGPQLTSVCACTKGHPSSAQVGGRVWEDELHSVVQMSFVGPTGGEEDGNGNVSEMGVQPHPLDGRAALTVGAGLVAGSTRQQDPMKIKL